MKDAHEFIGYHWKRVSDRWLRLSKRAYQSYKIRRIPERKAVLFIFGCQRSGTTLLAEIFERDFDNTHVYHEFSPLSSRDKIHKIRLNPLHIVKNEIDKNRASLVVLKPLVESQNALTLLNYFENSKAVWMYRHYRDVALSNLTLWGVKIGINNLRPIIEGQLQNWRSENISEETKHIVLKYFSEDMNPTDAAALFWVVRNRLFFELNLDKHPAVMMCKYDELIDDTVNTMTMVYKFSCHVYPSHKIPLRIYATSKGKGASIKLSKEIEMLCDEMVGKLDQAHDLKKQYSAPNNKIT